MLISFFIPMPCDTVGLGRMWILVWRNVMMSMDSEKFIDVECK
jgi:hypothetical protein